VQLGLEKQLGFSKKGVAAQIKGFQINNTFSNKTTMFSI